MTTFLNRTLRMHRITKQFVVLAFDIACSLIATWVAFTFRYEAFNIPTGIQWVAYGLSATLFIPFFIVFGLYGAIFRYSGVRSVASAAKATAIYGLLFFVILLIFRPLGVPRTVGVLQPIIFFALVSNGRLVASQLVQSLLSGNSVRKRVVIYGASDAGAQLAHFLNRSTEYRLSAFVDDDLTLVGRSIHGVKVHDPKRLTSLIDQHKVTEVLIALPNATIDRRRELVRSLGDLKVRVRSVPDLLDLARGNAGVDDFRDLDINDLIDRIPVIASAPFPEIVGNRVLVTGAGGSIGSELCRQILAMGPSDLVLVDHSEFNLYLIEQEIEQLRTAKQLETRVHAHLASVRDRKRLSDIFEKHRPTGVYHSAAYKHVPLVEQNPIEAITNNVVGTMNVALVAKQFGVQRMVLISTDKAVRPTNIMGATKRIAEQVVQGLASQRHSEDSTAGCTVYSMVRFGNVLGSSGSVVPLFRRQIQQGGPVTITHPEVTRFFMTIPEAVNLVLQAGHMAEGGEVFLLDMGKPVKIIDMARKMIRLSGLTERSKQAPDGDIEIIVTGLRPGEKLYEELLIGENIEPTANPQIKKAHEEFLAWDDLRGEIDQLVAAVTRNDIAETMAVFKRTVSGFDHRPNADFIERAPARDPE